MDEILIIRHGALGDLVQSLGPMQAVRRHHPGARITLLTTPPFQDFMAQCPWIDRIWLDDRPGWRRPAAWLVLRRRLRSGGFRRIYDLQTSGRSSLYYHLFPRGRKPEWCGIAAGCSHFHDNAGRDAMHTLERQADQLRVAGIAEVPPPDLSWLHGDGASFGLAAPYALVVPGGAPHRPAKRWPADAYVALCARLLDEAVTPVLIGGPDEARLAARIAGAAGARCVDLSARTSLTDIAGLARGAAVAVGNDTGPMHLIAVTGCPSMVLFSQASDPALCAPRGAAVRVMRSAKLGDLQPDRVYLELQQMLRP